jgi:hypothetical protein
MLSLLSGSKDSRYSAEDDPMDARPSIALTRLLTALPSRLPSLNRSVATVGECATPARCGFQIALGQTGQCPVSFAFEVNQDGVFTEFRDRDFAFDMFVFG